jgi:hypothetical protein
MGQLPDMFVVFGIWHLVSIMNTSRHAKERLLLGRRDGGSIEASLNSVLRRSQGIVVIMDYLVSKKVFGVTGPLLLLRPCFERGRVG